MIEVSIDLIMEAKQGNEKAWEGLLEKIYPIALGKALSLLRDKDLAQDAVQNAIIKVYNNLSSLKDEHAFWGWWIRILTNEIYLLLRLCQRNVGYIEFQASREKSVSIEDYVLLKVELARAIKNLPFEQQQILLEVDLLGNDLRETAVRYDIPLGTVKSRLFRARTKMQEILEYPTRHRKERSNMVKNEFTLSDTIYDYLEGTMSSGEKLKFEAELNKNPEIRVNIEKHKSFLSLLHSLTGKISLTVEEINETLKTTIEKISDYEEFVDETVLENGVPKTLTSHILFKSPDLYKIESNNPPLGSIVVCIKDNFALSWVKETKSATKVKVTEEYKERFTFTDTLKRMVTNKSVRIMGTEYLNGRPNLHLQLIEKVAQLGEMNTHLWIDKDTWMPMLIEYYNMQGTLVNRREVKALKMNQGLSDTLFEVEIPEDVTIEERSQEFNLPKEISLSEAIKLLSNSPYLFENQDYQIKHLWATLDEKSGILLSNYTVLGEIQPTFVLTQGPLPHVNIPSNLTTEPVRFKFNSEEVEGEVIYFNMSAAQVIVSWQYQNVYYSCGGQLGKNQLLEIIEKLARAQV